MYTEFRLVSFTNKKRKFKGYTRHWSIVCVICKKRKRNLLFHFKMYHPKYYQSTIKIAQEALQKGEIGIINGFRFMKSRKLKLKEYI